MTRQCELTGKLPMSGNIRRHALNSPPPVFRPNLCNVTLLSDTLGRKVKLRVSAHALKSVEHRGGLDKYLIKAKAETLSDKCRRLKKEIEKANAEAPVADAAAS